MTEVYFLVLPGTMLLDFAGTAEAFRAAARFGAPYRIHYVGTADSATSSLGLSIGGLAPLPAELPAHATLFIPGADESAVDYLRPEAVQAAAWLKQVIRPSHRLCTVCSGVFLAAQSGVLHGRTCTTHHQLTERLAREHPELHVLENRIFVRDGSFFSSAGVTTGVDLALHLIAEDTGPQVALEVARRLVIYLRRAGADPQLSPWLLHRNHLHPGLHRAQDAVIHELARPWSLDEMAGVAHTSPRHLVRLFHEYAGISPQTYVRQVRIASAKQIVMGSELGMERVAEMVGFTSAEQMRRAWQRIEGGNPIDFRRSARA